MHPNPRRVFLAVASMSAIGLALVTAYTRAQGTAGISKSALAVESVFTPIARQASKSTVRVFVQDHGNIRQVALGTIVSDDGYILTKGSEVVGQERVLVNLAHSRGPSEAKIVGWSEPLDLAMLKINASKLTPVTFADTRPPVTADAPGNAAGGRGPGRGRGGFGGRARQQPGPVVVPAATDPPVPPEGAVPVIVGEWVATPDAGATVGAELPPKYVGVISVTRRVNSAAERQSVWPAVSGREFRRQQPGSAAQNRGCAGKDRGRRGRNQGRRRDHRHRWQAHQGPERSEYGHSQL